MCDNNGDTFIATLHNVLLAPDLCDTLFSIITLILLGHFCLFHKGFFTIYFGAKENNAVTLPQSAQSKHAFLGYIKVMSKNNKSPARNKIVLELLHQRLGHRYTRSLLAGDTDNVWEDIEIKIDPCSFCKSCQNSSINKKDRSGISLKPKAPFKLVFMNIVPSTAYKCLPSLLIFDAYSKIPKCFGM